MSETITVLEEFQEVAEAVTTAVEADEAQSFDYTKPAENKAARSYVHGLRRIRADVDRVRKEAKADVLERGRRIDAQGKALTNQIMTVIDRHAAPIAHLEEQERARQAEIVAALDELEALRIVPAGESSADIAERLKRAQAIATRNDWGLHAERATDLIGAVLPDLRRAAEAAEKMEAQARELAELRLKQEAAERAERERIEREQEEVRRRAEAEERARAEAAAAEKAAREAREQAEREAAARERALQEEVERAKREAAAAEQRRLREAAEAEERRRREAARERAEQEARRRDEARRAEVFDDIQSAIAALDVSDETAAAVTTALTAGRVPHITVDY